MFRLIARLDIKGPSLIKSIRFEGLRVMGDPAVFAKRYSEGGADEILFMDTVATLYGRNQLAGLLEAVALQTFVPVAVGGGIGSHNDARRVFNAGADKIAINSAAIRQCDLIAGLGCRFGGQAVIVSIEAKRTRSGWEAYTDNGREKTGKDAIAWAHEAVERGAGEILLTSIDQEGTRQGFDLALLRALGPVPVPVVISGGCGSATHVVEALEAGADAVAIASILHYGLTTIRQLKAEISRLLPERTDIRDAA